MEVVNLSTKLISILPTLRVGFIEIINSAIRGVKWVKLLAYQ